MRAAEQLLDRAIFVSATPGQEELDKSEQLVEQRHLLMIGVNELLDLRF